jgi:PD-(D/E)XK endonuclease
MVAAALARQGFTVSPRIGENARYDMVIEKDGALSRVKPSRPTVRNISFRQIGRESDEVGTDALCGVAKGSSAPS